MCVCECEWGLFSHLFDAAFKFKSRALISTRPLFLLPSESAAAFASHHVPSSRLLSSPAPSSPLISCLGQTRQLAIAAVFIELLLDLVNGQYYENCNMAFTEDYWKGLSFSVLLWGLRRVGFVLSSMSEWWVHLWLQHFLSLSCSIILLNIFKQISFKRVLLELHQAPVLHWPATTASSSLHVFVYV